MTSIISDALTRSSLDSLNFFNHHIFINGCNDSFDENSYFNFQPIKGNGVYLYDKDGHKVLDFAGVQIVDNSFADECLAKILLVMPLEELKKRTTFASLNELAQKNIVIASRRRIKALESAA